MKKQTLIMASLLILSGCAPTQSAVQAPKNDEIQQHSSSTTSSAVKVSNVMMKAKCLEMGQNNPAFEERTTEKDWIHYNFYYSSVLDTCVAEKMIDRLVNDDVGSWHVLFDMLKPEGLDREIISHYSWCLDGKNPAHPEVACKTAAQYEAEKNRILTDY